LQEPVQFSQTWGGQGKKKKSSIRFQVHTLSVNSLLITDNNTLFGVVDQCNCPDFTEESIHLD
jgi:hypothetical protein